jgi:transcription elongation factor Elf1
MENKICSNCKNEKEITLFPFRNKVKNVRHNICGECWKEVRRISYNNNKDTTLERNKRNNNKTKQWYDEYKSTLECLECGENHISCLDFHHTDRNSKEFNISSLLFSTYSIETIKKEIEKCVVLCANCHRKLHYNEKLKSNKSLKIP